MYADLSPKLGGKLQENSQRNGYPMAGLYDS